MKKIKVIIHVYATHNDEITTILRRLFYGIHIYSMNKITFSLFLNKQFFQSCFLKFKEVLLLKNLKYERNCTNCIRLIRLAPYLIYVRGKCDLSPWRMPGLLTFPVYPWCIYCLKGVHIEDTLRIFIYGRFFLEPYFSSKTYFSWKKCSFFFWLSP